MANEKLMIILLTVRLTKKILLYKMSYCFPEPHTDKNKIEVELDLSIYTTKSDLKNATDNKLDSDKLEKVPSGLSSLKSKVDKLDADKLLLLIRINLLKTDCNAKINEIKGKMPSVSDLVKKQTIMLRSLKLKVQIEGKIPSVSDLVKKTNYNAKINEIKC